MTYKSPLGRLPRTSRRPAEARHDIIPDVIHLPDGRTIAVSDILQRPRNRQHYNLVTGKITAKKTARPVDTDTTE